MKIFLPQFSWLWKGFHKLKLEIGEPYGVVPYLIFKRFSVLKMQIEGHPWIKNWQDRWKWATCVFELCNCIGVNPHKCLRIPSSQPICYFWSLSVTYVYPHNNISKLLIIYLARWATPHIQYLLFTVQGVWEGRVRLATYKLIYIRLKAHKVSDKLKSMIGLVCISTHFSMF